MNETSAENEKELEKRYRLTTLIVGAQIAFSVVLAILAWFGLGNTDSSNGAQFSTALWILVLFVAIGTFLLRRILFKWERLKKIALSKGTPGIFSALQRSSILLGALAEAIAVIGFVISVINGNKTDVLRAVAVALIVFFINFPRKSVWEKIVAGMEKV